MKVCSFEWNECSSFSVVPGTPETIRWEALLHVWSELIHRWLFFYFLFARVCVVLTRSNQRAALCCLHRPSRTLQGLQLQTRSPLRSLLTPPKQHSPPTPNPLSLLPLPLLTPLAALWSNPRPQWPVSPLPSPLRVQPVSWSTLMRISHW